MIVNSSLDLIISGGQSCVVLLHSLAKGKLLRVLRHPLYRPIHRLLLSPKTKMLLLYSSLKGTAGQHSPELTEPLGPGSVDGAASCESASSAPVALSRTTPEALLRPLLAAPGLEASASEEWSGYSSIHCYTLNGDLLACASVSGLSCVPGTRDGRGQLP